MAVYNTTKGGSLSWPLVILVLGLVGIVLFFTAGKTPVQQYSNTAVGGTTYNGQLCPALNQVAQMASGYVDYSKTPPTYTQAAVPYNVINPTYNNGTVAQWSGALSATITGNVPYSGSLNCGGTYTFVYGEDNTYYINSSTVNVGTQVSPSITLLTWKYGAATAKSANSYTATYASTSNTYNALPGAVVTPFMYIQAGAQWYGEPQYGFLAVFAYNNLAVSSVVLSGAPVYTGRIPASFLAGNAAEGSQTTQIAYVLPAIHNSQYATPSGATPSYSTMSPVITMGSSFTAANQVTVVGLLMAPLSNFYLNGKVIPNVAVDNTGSVLPWGSVNQQRFFGIYAMAG